MWHTSACAILPAVVLPFYALPAIAELIATCGYETTVCKPTQTLWVGYGFSCGYQLFDISMMVFYHTRLKKLLTPNFYWTLMAHHSLAVIFWTIALAGGKVTGYSTWVTVLFLVPDSSATRRVPCM
jgi:hypothetical protein